jgi:hypothetical protein
MISPLIKTGGALHANKTRLGYSLGSRFAAAAGTNNVDAALGNLQCQLSLPVGDAFLSIIINLANTLSSDYSNRINF